MNHAALLLTSKRCWWNGCSHIVTQPNAGVSITPASSRSTTLEREMQVDRNLEALGPFRPAPL